MEEGFVQFRNKKLWYCVFGKEKIKTPLLVIHGGPGFCTMTDVVSDFSGDRPVYFYDQLGSYRSDKADSKDEYSLNYFIDELEAVITGLKLTNCILLGFSWGCALIAAYMLEKHPRGIKALILSGPLLSSPRWDADQRENIALLPLESRIAIEHGEKTGVYDEAYNAAMMEYYKRHLCLMDPWPTSLTDGFGRLNNDVYNVMWGPSEFTITGKLKTFDLFPRLPQIIVPVLLTCGDHDEAGVKTVKDFQMRLGKGQLAVIPHAAHLHHIEQPEIYKAVVNAFLKNK